MVYREIVGATSRNFSLKGRGKPSQTDVWALLRADSGLISMAVEGKAGEPFASTIGEWLKDASDGKKERLNYLCEVLQSSDAPAAELRYQLYHRTASAVIEAQRFGATFAVMLVQSFREDSLCWNDYCAFCSLLGATAVRGSLVEARRKGSERLFLGWVDSKVASDSEFAKVV